MNSIDDFVAFVREEIGLPVTAQSVGESFDRLPGWDSVHLLTLVTGLERQTGRRLAMAEILEAASLSDIYGLAVPA